MNIPRSSYWKLLLIIMGMGPSLASGQVQTPVRKANWELLEAWNPWKVTPVLASARVNPNWIPGGDSFWYRRRIGKGGQYWLVDPSKKEKRLLFDHERLAGALAQMTGKEFEAGNLPLEEIEFVEGNTAIRFRAGEEWFTYDLAGGTIGKAAPISRLNEPYDNVSPDGRFAVFARGNNIFLAESGDDGLSEKQLTFDGEGGLVWGSDMELVPDGDSAPRRVEAQWSGDSRKIFILGADVRNVKDLWFVDHLKNPRPTMRTVKYPMPGEAVPQWELWIYSCETGKLVGASTSRWPDQHLVDFDKDIVWWSKDSSTIYACRRSRDYLRADLCAVDPETGACKVVVEERQKGEIFLQAPVELSNGDRLIWWSQRDGWGHYYLYSKNGTLINRITRGTFNAERILSVDEKNRVLFFSANGRERGRNPYYQHIYRVDLDGSNLRLLSPEDAFHEGFMSSSAEYLVDNVSRVDLPTRSMLRNADGDVVMELESTDVSDLQKAGWKTPETFHAEAADKSTDLWGVMYKPLDFDPHKKYPLITRVYPGRFDELIPLQFAANRPEQSLANLGCIVVQFGNRGGSRLRGTAYANYGRSEFRDYGLADKKFVIEQLAERFDFIDIERVGIFGGSSGGFMTVSAMLVYPDFFKVGVAIAAPNDPSQYFNEWVERYSDRGQKSNPDGSITWEWEAAPGNIELADSLKGDLLMIYGGRDELVHLGHLFRMADTFIKAGKHFDMFIIPDVGHDMGGGYYSYELLWRYFAQHLIER